MRVRHARTAGWKRALVPLIGPFDRLCILPQHINKCFDWDLTGTRWQRVGMTLSLAYETLGFNRGLRPLGGPSLKEVKRAYREIAMANHPDKVKAAPGFLAELLQIAASDGASIWIVVVLAVPLLRAQPQRLCQR